MGLYLRRIARNGFRKFQGPMTIQGLADDLDIVIQPDESDKSTMLEARDGWN